MGVSRLVVPALTPNFFSPVCFSLPWQFNHFWPFPLNLFPLMFWNYNSNKCLQYNHKTQHTDIQEVSLGEMKKITSKKHVRRGYLVHTYLTIKCSFLVVSSKRIKTSPGAYVGYCQTSVIGTFSKNNGQLEVVNYITKNFYYICLMESKIRLWTIHKQMFQRVTVLNVPKEFL